VDSTGLLVDAVQFHRLARGLRWPRVQGKNVAPGTAIMPTLNSAQQRSAQFDGMVLRVDLINRELVVFVEGDLVNIFVPVDCKVVLRGERVKLRLLHSRDRVRVTFTRRGDTIVAQAIEVNSR
jgi:hypothetical protein